MKMGRQAVDLTVVRGKGRGQIGSPRAETGKAAFLENNA